MPRPLLGHHSHRVGRWHERIRVLLQPVRAFIAATWVFPHEPPEGADLDTHFFENKRSIFLLVLACNLIAHGARTAVVGIQQLPVAWGLLGAYFALLLVGAFARSKAVNLIALVLLLFIYVTEGVWTAFMTAGRT